MIPTTYS